MCKKIPQNLLMVIIGVIEIIAATMAVTAVGVNSLLTTSADSDVIFRAGNAQTRCGVIDVDVTLRLNEWSFNAQSDLNDTACGAFLDCEDIGLNSNCKSQDTYNYKKAKNNFCNETDSGDQGNDCKTAKVLARVSTTYIALCTTGYTLLYIAGFGLIMFAAVRRYYCGITNKDDEEGTASKSENRCLRCCSTYVLELFVMILNFVCALFFLIGFLLALLLKFEDRAGLDESIESALNQQYGGGTGVELSWDINVLSDGGSVAPMSIAFVICYLIFSWMALSAFCTSLCGFCRCCCGCLCCCCKSDDDAPAEATQPKHIPPSGSVGTPGSRVTSVPIMMGSSFEGVHTGGAAPASVTPHTGFVATAPIHHPAVAMAPTGTWAPTRASQAEGAGVGTAERRLV
jgi:hypothetical protein